MSEFYLNALLLPLLFLPLLTVCGLISKRTAMLLWFSFLMSAVIYSLKANAVYSAVILVGACIGSVTIKSFSFNKSKSSMLIIVSADCYKNEIVCSDGCSFHSFCVLDADAFKPGSIIRVINK